MPLLKINKRAKNVRKINSVITSNTINPNVHKAHKVMDVIIK